jgi:hypothetical protein
MGVILVLVLEGVLDKLRLLGSAIPSSLPLLGMELSL